LIGWPWHKNADRHVVAFFDIPTSCTASVQDYSRT
jgi:hypothetical protein